MDTEKVWTQHPFSALTYRQVPSCKEDVSILFIITMTEVLGDKQARIEVIFQAAK